MSLPGGPQMNKCEQVSSHHHLMSLAGEFPKFDVQGEGAQVWCPEGRREGGYTTWPFPGGAYNVTYPMMHLMLPSSCEQTDACENITFPQAYLRAVKNRHSTLKFLFILIFQQWTKW